MICGTGRFWAWSETATDDDSGESTVEDVVAGVGRDESESEWLVRGCRREAGSWLQRRGEAYWKERSVVRNYHKTMDSPKTGSLLQPFSRTPFGVGSMRKCRTRSASGSSANNTESEHPRKNTVLINCVKITIYTVSHKNVARHLWPKLWKVTVDFNNSYTSVNRNCYWMNISDCIENIWNITALCYFHLQYFSL